MEECTVSRNITLTNGGGQVKLNGFVREMMINVIVGLVKPLKGFDPAKEIVVTIGPDSGSSESEGPKAEEAE